MINQNINYKFINFSLQNLWPSLPEDQAGVIHAISPFWMKLCQIEGTTQQLLKTKWAGFVIFPLGVRLPPLFFCPKSQKCH